MAKQLWDIFVLYPELEKLDDDNQNAVEPEEFDPQTIIDFLNKKLNRLLPLPKGIVTKKANHNIFFWIGMNSDADLKKVKQDFDNDKRFNDCELSIAEGQKIDNTLRNIFGISTLVGAAIAVVSFVLYLRNLE